MLFIYYGFYDFGWTPLPCKSDIDSLCCVVTIDLFVFADMNFSRLWRRNFTLPYASQRSQHHAFSAKYCTSICESLRESQSCRNSQTNQNRMVESMGEPSCPSLDHMEVVSIMEQQRHPTNRLSCALTCGCDATVTLFTLHFYVFTSFSLYCSFQKQGATSFLHEYGTDSLTKMVLLV